MVVCFLFYVMLKKEIESSLQMLTFLKRMKGHKKMLKGRFINVILCSAQLCMCFAGFCTCLLAVCESGSLAHIIKSWMSMFKLLSIDNWMVMAVPANIKKNARNLNAAGLLTMGDDFNTFGKIYRRLFHKGPGYRQTNIIIAFGSILVNIWHFFLLNFHLIWCSYMGPITVLVIHFVGYEYLNKLHDCDWPRD